MQVSAVRRHRSRNVGHGHGFCIFTAPSPSALWQLPSGKASWLRHHARARRSVLSYSSASFAPARPAPERITPRRCRLIVTAWGMHRFSASSPAVVHLRFAPDHFFRLRFRSPMPEERSSGERKTDEESYRNPSPRPPPAILCGRGSRPHVCEMFYLIRRRHPPRRMLPRSGSRLFSASRPLLQREAATAPDASDTVAAGVACVWYCQRHRQPIR